MSTGVIYKEINKKLTLLRKRAKTKKISFDLDKNWLVKRLSAGICEATGIKFTGNTHPFCDPFVPSIDRSEISKGYTPENCRLVIWAYNCGKAHYTDEDLYKMCKAFIKNT